MLGNAIAQPNLQLLVFFNAKDAEVTYISALQLYADRIVIGIIINRT